MKLLKTFEFKLGNIVYTDWEIYELDETEQALFGRKYAVTNGTYDDFLSKYSATELLRSLSLWRGERLFDTYNEAFMHIKLMEVSHKVSDGLKWIDELEETHREKLTAMNCYNECCARTCSSLY